MQILNRFFLTVLFSMAFAGLSGQNQNIKAVKSDLNPVIDGKPDNKDHCQCNGARQG